MVLLPAAQDTGVLFRRTDLGSNAEVRAHRDNNDWQRQRIVGRDD